jgi:hypothetical protein
MSSSSNLDPRLAPSSRRHALGRGARALAAALGLAGAAACGDSSPAIDATATPSTESAEISIRFDVSAGKPTTVEVLAFRATTSQPGGGEARPDVLGIVDPLAAESPEPGCTLRDIDLATKTLALRGSSIDLQELTGIGVGMGGGRGANDLASGALLRPFPRLYPDVATVVGGVVAEAGPQYLGALPEKVTLFTSESELPVVDLGVPTAARLVTVNGEQPFPGFGVDAGNGLSIAIAGGAGGRVELRPYGSTIAATCSIPANGSPEAVVDVPRAFIVQLARAAQLAHATGLAVGAPLPVSLEIARRTHLVSSLGGAPARVSVEVRSAATVELRP